MLINTMRLMKLHPPRHGQGGPPSPMAHDPHGAARDMAFPGIQPCTNLSAQVQLSSMSSSMAWWASGSTPSVSSR